jgi:hypothetical protein
VAVSSRNPGDAEARGSSAGLRKFPGGEVRRVRGLSGSVALRSSGPMARQRGRHGGARGGGAGGPRGDAGLGLGLWGSRDPFCRAARLPWRAGPGRAARRWFRGPLRAGEEGRKGKKALTRGDSGSEGEKGVSGVRRGGIRRRHVGPGWQRKKGKGRSGEAGRAAEPSRPTREGGGEGKEMGCRGKGWAERGFGLGQGRESRPAAGPFPFSFFSFSFLHSNHSNKSI